MADERDKKIVVFYVLKILQEYTDENHYLTYGKILEKLQTNYGIKPDIKSVAKNVDTLIEAGYEIIKLGVKGCYLSWRDFNSGELMFLVDAINSSKAIHPKQAKELIDRLIRNCSKYEKKKYIAVQKIDDMSKAKSKDLFFTIEILAEAIENKKQVLFNYNEFKINKELKPRVDGKEFIINPYFMVNSRGKYYLVCNYDKYNNLSNYKIECISNIKILDKPIKPIKQLDNTENFSIKKYINEHIYMTNGKSVNAEIKLDDVKNVNDVVDWFGDSVSFKVEDNLVYAELTANEQALAYWALQYGECVEVVKPASTIKLIKAMLNDIQKKYGNEL